MKIEEFIKNNKELFEEEVPSNVWAKLDKQLSTEKKFKISFNNKILRIAAGVIVCLTVGYIFGKFSNQKNSQQFSEVSGVNSSLVRFSDEIKEKQEALQELTEKNPELGKAFISELGQLQTNFEYLEEQLKYNPNHDQIVDAMIQNLKWQLELLEKQTEIAKIVENKQMM